LDCPEEDKQRDKRGDASAGVADEIRSQDAGNGAAGSDGGNVGARAHNDLQHRRGNAGSQIEQQKIEVAKAVFNAAAKDKEKEHIPQQVQPSTMEEHGDEDWRHGEAQRQSQKMCGGIAGRNQAIQKNEAVQVRAKRKLNDKSPDIRHDQEQGKGPKGAPVNMIG